MKTIFLITAILISTISFSQKKIDLKALETLPADLELKDVHQKYIITTDHFNGDIFGNFFNKFRVKGEYTRGLDHGKAKWNNVTVAMSMQQDAEFTEGTPLNYMENYTYSPSDDMLKQEAFTDFKEHSAFAKNLVWDMMGIEVFAWTYWDKLKLNIPYEAKDINGEIDLAGQGSFENKNIIITWTGVSLRNGELCATIQYRTMDNPLEYEEMSMAMKGRSHYWGTIWVSLEDKQVEHANLFEDVVMEMQLSGQPGKQMMNTTRVISFNKKI
ncbi:MAG: hypothetical protein ABFS16_15815 [Bacteroidota bacterium]